MPGREVWEKANELPDISELSSLADILHRVKLEQRKPGCKKKFPGTDLCRRYPGRTISAVRTTLQEKRLSLG